MAACLTMAWRETAKRLARALRERMPALKWGSMAAQSTGARSSRWGRMVAMDREFTAWGGNWWK